MIFVGVLERIVDEFNREHWQPQMEGGKAARELPAIVDQVITMSLFEPDGDGWRHEPAKAQVRRLVCRSGNPYGLPAKDRSGRLDHAEPPDLGALLAKIGPPGPPELQHQHGGSSTCTTSATSSRSRLDLIPDGTFAKVTMTIRPGGVDGQTEIDQGLLKASTTPGSDVLSLDCEFTVVQGRLVRASSGRTSRSRAARSTRRSASIGWNISKRTFRAMIDSALGLDPDDNSEEAKAKRRLRGLADLDGITFVAKITVEPSNDPATRTEQARPAGAAQREEWRAVMNGEDVAPSPSRPRSAGSAPHAAPHGGEAAWGSSRRSRAAGRRGAWQRPATAASGQDAGGGRPAGQAAWLNQ